MERMKSGARNLVMAGVTLCFGGAGAAQMVFPVRISADRRYLIDAGKKPFPILGRTAWFIVSQPDSGYKKFLANTVAHGHNAIEMAVITHWPMGNHAPFNGNGELPFLRTVSGQRWRGNLVYDSIRSGAPDFLTPNPAYWKFVDDFLAYCETKGILVFMFPAYVGYAGEEQGWMKELIANGVEKVTAYGEWIAGRYKKRKNIVWMLLGDMGKFSAEQKNAEAALIKGLKAVKGQASIEYTAECSSGQNSADNADFGHEMTLNASYTWELKVPVPYIARKAYQHSPVMPSFLLEEPYDEEGPDGNNYNPNATQPVRRFQWWGWLSTIGGYISGNGFVWQFVDPVWQKHLNTQAALDNKRLNIFIRSIPWWQLVPSGLGGTKKIIMGPNADTSASFIAAAATRTGSLVVAYVPPAHAGPFDVNMDVLSAKSFGYWFDPTDGSYRMIGKSSFANNGIRSFMPPGKNSAGDADWVLMLTVRPR